MAFNILYAYIQDVKNMGVNTGYYNLQMDKAAWKTLSDIKRLHALRFEDILCFPYVMLLIRL